MDSLRRRASSRMPAIVSVTGAATFVLVLLTRPTFSFARGRKLGIRNLQVDDYLMVFAVVWYTMLCVALNEVASGGGSNLMDEYDIKHLTPAIHAERVSGSKWVFVSEHSYLLTTWTLKSCMLVIYARITYVSLCGSSIDGSPPIERAYVRSG